MNIYRQEIRTGLLVVVSIAALVAVILYLGAPGVFIPQKSFVVYVTNIGGLKQGADVALAGRKIGRVGQVYSPVPKDERPEPRFETKIVVKVARSAQIYNTVKCTLTSTGLLGEFYIDFTEGDQASGLAIEGKTFLCERPPGLEQAVPKVLETIDPTLKSANETMAVLQKTAENLTRLTGEGGELPRALAEYRKFGENLNTLAGPGGSLKVTLDNLAQLSGPEGKLQHVLANLEKLTGEDGSLARAMKNAEKFTGDLVNNRDLEVALKNAREASTELSRTIRDLREKFAEIAENLAQATDTIKHQPWRLIYPGTKKYPEEEEEEKKQTGERRRPRKN